VVIRRGAEPDDDRLLMVRQTRVLGERWEIPGGNQEASESLEQTAAREVAEECGIDVIVGDLLCTYLLQRPQSGRAGLGAFYLAEAVDPSTEPVTAAPEEILEAAYVDPTALPPELVGPVTGVVLRRWWPRRSGPVEPPFHVAVRRTPNGYVEV
jgi:ADP-ribose pyrophosphatase YjhB (NUDIX family)